MTFFRRDAREQVNSPEATKELEEILDNLEEALINMKSRKDFDRSKAIVERYERKARMYYSNHPKIKALLAEVDEEMKLAEKKVKSAERKATLTSILKNKFIWACLPFMLCIPLFIKCQSVGTTIGTRAERDPYIVGIILCVIVGFFACSLVIGKGDEK